MDLFRDHVPSPLGTLHLVHDGKTLRALDFDDYEPRLHRLLTRHYGPLKLSPLEAPPAIRQALCDYFDGKLKAIDAIPVETNGSEFQRRVWAGLRTIPAGRTISYGVLAIRIGKPLAVRAVGLANGANPVGIVVPCHRVIGADGRLTGYGGGIERKRWLLMHEKRVAEPSLFEVLAN